MAHLIQEYAKNLGVKISKPIVKEHYFPIQFDKYITISVDSSTTAKNYKHYGIVLFILKDFFKRHGIKIVQLGGQQLIDGVNSALNLPFKQQAYVISKSLLHLGCDGALNHLSSLKSVPTITLFGNTFASANKPVFSSSSSLVNLEPEWTGKPSFNQTGDEINKIKPEDIANHIIRLLKVEKCKVNFKTIKIGSFYDQSIVEVIPISFHELSIPQNQNLYVRADYGFDEAAFLQYCQNYKVSIFLNSLIRPNHLQNFAANVKNIFIWVKKDDDVIPDSYLKTLKNMGINVILLVKNEKDLPFLRNIYFDTVVQQYRPEVDKYEGFNKNARFLSAKRLICNGKQYLSPAHWKKNLDNNNQVLDSPEYFCELDHFYIYEQGKKNNNQKSNT